MISLSLLLVALVSTSCSVGANSLPKQPGLLESISIEASDGSAKANFMRYGATALNFWVPDKNGKFRDILLGWDNHTNYQSDVDGHPYFGPIVGRYANRIRNGTFTIPISKDASGPGTLYQIPKNEKGLDTLHGGLDGFDRRNWTLAEYSSNSVTFTMIDINGTQGFPGTVLSTVKYSLEDKSTWKISIHATASSKTPILLSGHHYWNLEAYEETQDLVGHYAQFDASRIIHTDGILIPDGPLTNVTGTPLDFKKAKSIGASIPDTASHEYCGTGCTGFDNCWIYTDNPGDKPVFSVWSINSGIKLDVITDQPALQVYTCNGIYDASLPIPRKKSQGGPSAYYQDHSCMVIEQESWIDAINNPEWGIDQIYGPGRDYKWESSYIFSTLKK